MEGNMDPNTPGIAYFLAALYYMSGLLTNWALPFIRDMLIRWKRQITSRRKIVVLVDRQKQRRHCFWKDVYKKSNKIRLYTYIQFISIADELRKKKNIASLLFDRTRVDYIIVNWDAANGDPVYGSDRTREFLKHYRPDLIAWIKQGGILLVESQGASWAAIQDVYEIFNECFEDTSLKVAKSAHLTEDEIICPPDSQNHPLLRDISSKVLKLEKACLCEQRRWFPIQHAHLASLEEAERSPRKLYRGFFEEFHGWEPLLLSKMYKKPVAVYKTLSGNNEVGACVLTTMFIASSWPSSGLSSLVEILLINLPDELSNIHFDPTRHTKL
jgi:hypothetical protein